MTAIVSYSGQNTTSFATGGTARWATASNGSGVLSTSEVLAQITYEHGGTFSKLSVFILTNVSTATTTINFRVNGANGNQSVSIATLATGFFQDVTNTDVISAGDEVNLQISAAGGVGAVVWATTSFLFASSTDSVTRHSYRAVASFSSASTTSFEPLTSGNLVTGEADTEDKTQSYSGIAGKLVNLFVYVSVNNRVNDSTVRSRVNTANGNLIVTISAGSTGIFEDLSNSDTISAADLINYSFTLGTGTQTITCNIISVEFVSTLRQNLVIAGRADAGVSLNSATTAFFTVGGVELTNTNFLTESTFRNKALSNFTASNLSIRLDSNTINGTSSFTLRANASNTTLTVSITAATSGRFTDTVNTPSIVLNDILTHGITTGGSSGSLDFRMAAFSATYPSTSSVKDMLRAGAILPYGR